MVKRKRQVEHLPWYRARNYKGDLTETEKRQLDAFRKQPKHPAAEEDDLPEEVRNYIGKIELELYDRKQDAIASNAFFSSAIGAALLFLNYKGWLGGPTIWAYVGAGLLLVLPWLYYWYQRGKNADEFLPDDLPDPTDEGIRREWEVQYIARNRQAERHASGKDT